MNLQNSWKKGLFRQGCKVGITIPAVIERDIPSVPVNLEFWLIYNLGNFGMTIRIRFRVGFFFIFHVWAESLHTVLYCFKGWKMLVIKFLDMYIAILPFQAQDNIFINSACKFSSNQEFQGIQSVEK